MSNPFNFNQPGPTTPRPPFRRRSKGAGLWIGLGIAAVLLLLLCGGAALFVVSRLLPHTANTAEPSPPEKAIAIEATALFNKYQADLPSAELAYTGKELEISGIQPTVQKDESGRYFLLGPDCRTEKSSVVYSNPYEAAANTRYVPGVILYVDPADLKQFAGVNKSKTVTVQGRCRGSRKDAAADPEFVVEIDDCEYVRASKGP